MSGHSLSERLPLKRVAAWSVAYLAAGWVAIEVTSVVGPQFNISEELQRAVTILIGFGLLAVLVLAWHADRERALRLPGVLLLACIGAAATAAAAGSVLKESADPETDLRVISAEPEAGSVLRREDLSAGVPIRVVVEHGVEEWVDQDANLTVSLMSQVSGPDGGSSDGSWRIITERPARPERSRVAVEATLTPQSVMTTSARGEIIVRVALATRTEGSITIGSEASVLLYYPVAP